MRATVSPGERLLAVLAAVLLGANLLVLATAGPTTDLAEAADVAAAVDAPDTPGTSMTPGGDGATAAARAADLAVPGGATPSPIPPAAEDRDLLVPAEGARLGALVSVAAGTAREQEEAAWRDHERAAGRPMDLAHVVYDEGEVFPTWREAWHREQGRVPLVSWSPGPVADVLAGRLDDVLRARARGVADLGSPILLRLGAAPDGLPATAAEVSAEDERRAWRHVVGLFREAGAHAAVWVWCRDAAAFADGRADLAYPGDDVVDWTCAEGYNASVPGADPSRWRGAKAVFGGFHAWGRARGKPMLVAAFATGEDDVPGGKGAWFEQLEVLAPRALPGVRAWISLEADNGVDLRVTSSPTALEGYVRMARSAWFRLGSVHPLAPG